MTVTQFAQDNINMTNNVSGSCLCARVTFTVNNEFSQFYFCHCLQCRKITGSAHAANLFTAPNNIHWHSGKEFIKRFEHPKRNFTKAFCTQCGCAVPFITQSGRALLVPAGSLDQVPEAKVSAHIFWRDRAPWYEDALKARHCPDFDDPSG
jgi:hypothetical protein